MLRKVFVLLYITSFESRKEPFSPAPIVRENSEKGGALHSLRRSSIPCSKQKCKMDLVCFSLYDLA